MGVKMACLKIVLMNKMATIDTSYTKIKPVHAQYAANIRHAKLMLTGLLFCLEVKVFV